MTSDADLLRHFAETQDEACFAEIAQRHVRFVYAVTLRRLRDPHAAQDATQAVFIALARKARSVAGAPSVIGWLHRSACYETRNLMRAQTNRRVRETEAERLGTTLPEARPQLEALEGMLDDVLNELSEADREAILARYFSEKPYAEIGAALRSSENAARMRVERALLKLRDHLARRGVTSTAAALATALPSYASASVPSGLAAVVTKASVLGLASGTGAAATIGFMSTAKMVTGVAVATAVGGLLYQYHRTSELELELAAARAETVGARQQFLAIQEEIAGLKQQARMSQQHTTAAAPGPTGGSAPTVAAAASAASVPVPGVTPKAPAGWHKNGSAPDLYEVGVDENNSWGGMPSAYARSIGAADGKFGGMMQTISAEAYLNQRVRLTGWIKTEDVEKGGQLWLRVDGPQQGQSLQFDNMHGRAPKGTTDWEEYSIVLDVPSESRQLAYGFFVAGKGKMWVNGLTITPVAGDVPSTNLKVQQQLPKTPVNLGFSPPAN